MRQGPRGLEALPQQMRCSTPTKLSASVGKGRDSNKAFPCSRTDNGLIGGESLVPHLSCPNTNASVEEGRPRSSRGILVNAKGLSHGRCHFAAVRAVVCRRAVRQWPHGGKENLRSTKSVRFTGGPLMSLFILFLFSFGGGVLSSDKTEESEASVASDCPLLDPRCLLNYTIKEPDYFYRRRHEVPVQAAATRRLQEHQAESSDENESGSDSIRMLSESEVFEFAVRRLQGIGGLFASQRQPPYTGGGAVENGGKRRQQQPSPLSLDIIEPLDSGRNKTGRPLLESNGLVCEDDERVEDFGVKCRLIARSLGGRLGCEKRLIDISPDGRLPANIPVFSRVADACPMTCGLCEECAPGCALWFLGNTLCDAVCNNAACQFDGGDCWSADCVVGPWSQWSDCSVTCGGPGTQRRTRDVKSRAKQGGSPCPKLEVSNCRNSLYLRKSVGNLRASTRAKTGDTSVLRNYWA